MQNSGNTNQTDNQERHNSALVVQSGASSIPIGVSSMAPSNHGEIVVHNHDVLSGRGVHIAHHPGNERFRSLVTSFTDKHYCTSYTVSEKKALAVQIIQHIRSLDPPGRFLKREGKAGASRGLSGPWQVLTEREVIKKACQALRDCNRQDRVGYADTVKPPEDVKKVAETLSRSGLSVRERAVAAAVALEKRPNSNQRSNSSYCQNGRNPPDTRKYNEHNNQDSAKMGVKRTKDEIDNEYYASLPPKGNHREIHFSSYQVGIANYANVTASKDTLEPKPIFDMQPYHSFTNGGSAPSHFYYRNSNNQFWGSGQGSAAYGNASYGSSFHCRFDAYNEYKNGKDTVNPCCYHPYGRSGMFQPESGFSRSFDHSSSQDQNSAFSTRISNCKHESSENLYPKLTTKQVHDDTYHDFIPSNFASHQNLDSHNLIPFEETWPMKKQRTEEIDSTIGISTSASSPSTPAALGNNDELAISSSIPTSSDVGFKNVGGNNSLHAAYADIFKSDSVDVWENDPIETGSLGVDESEEGGIVDDLNADELFSF
jgi:hypothetical protein